MKEVIEDREWATTYGQGFKRLEKLAVKKGSYKEFKFDVLMANPPFAGDIKETMLLSNFDFGTDGKGKQRNKVGRDILFIERNLDFVRPGVALLSYCRKGGSITVRMSISEDILLKKHASLLWWGCMAIPLNRTQAQRRAFCSYKNGIMMIVILVITARRSKITPSFFQYLRRVERTIREIPSIF